MGDAQRKRWAESKKESEPAASEEAPKTKRRLSKAGKAAIVAALKKRWAAKKAAGVKTAPVVAKKTVKKAPVKASRKAAKKVTAKRPQRAATPAPATSPVATE
jgi:hypothetical protein